MSPFKNIFKLSVGDFIAKTLNFLAFVYLARVLGVETYGVLEFSLSIMTYFLLLGDGGLELWATREAAAGKDMRELVSKVVPLRLLLAVGSYIVLFGVLLVLPSYPGLRTVLIIFGLTLFAQAISLKWVFMGQERMTRVAGGLVITQIVFASSIFAFVHNPRAIIWVPVFKLTSDLAMAVYFGMVFSKKYDGFKLNFNLRGVGNTMRPALTLGASHSLAFMNYNFDSILLGLMMSPLAVGWYNAAYKPVTVVLAMPTTYFIGLFPALSRAHATDHNLFVEIATRSFKLAAAFAVPIGIGSLFLAEPIITFLFGPAYASAVPVFQILGWSAVLVILRGTFRQSLNAAGVSHLDLRCAAASVALNVTLNLLLIPRFGIKGAAVATLVSEVLWFSMGYYYFRHYISKLNLRLLQQPVTAAIVMTIFFLVSKQLYWGARMISAPLIYFGVLWLLDKQTNRFRNQLEQLPPATQEQTTP